METFVFPTCNQKLDVYTATFCFCRSCHSFGKTIDSFLKVAAGIARYSFKKTLFNSGTDLGCRWLGRTPSSNSSLGFRSREPSRGPTNRRDRVTLAKNINKEFDSSEVCGELFLRLSEKSGISLLETKILRKSSNSAESLGSASTFL
ncbi:hypothetical protein TNCV_4416161 [Trichonephila clavipes]|uniref:Uncharacterized protein n=1 Tax=Trichonephila clavipes TaxID=2585209 RepID=A0A8X6S4K2_TRICX|nr:hypothetical protein TNCV_4416161 [Trichonephila clavipes]